MIRIWDQRGDIVIGASVGLRVCFWYDLMGVDAEGTDLAIADREVSPEDAALGEG